MGKRVLLFGLVLGCLAYAQTHPIEVKISAKLISALRDEIRESERFNKSVFPVDLLLVENKNITFPVIESDDVAAERSPCINLGNDGCVNGSIVGSGVDGEYLGGGGNPGK